MELNYDKLLLATLPHLQKHPNYLPHIGKNFEQSSQRIMIVAESHYIHEKYNGFITPKEWYENPESIYTKIGNNKGWFNTREVLQTYFKDKKNNTVKGGLKLFQNLEIAYKTVFKTSDLFDECVFINYYQRPAESQGDSIIIHSIDSKVALENILTLIDVLKLDKIIFVSSKAYDDFIANTTKKQRATLPYIGTVPHAAASSWWNRKSPKYGIESGLATGREKFERIIKPKNQFI